MHARQAERFAAQLVDKYDLDLTGLVVLTEGASNAYLYNPLIAIVAGADRVLTYVKGSRFGSVQEVVWALRESYSTLDHADKYEVIDELTETAIGAADIVTNSGHLRPFNADFIKGMKPTAVLPLMWESWELREHEIDLKAARERGVLVMGTNEHQAPCDMRIYTFLTALKLMMEHEVALPNENILLIGDQESLAGAIETGLQAAGLACRRRGAVRDLATWPADLEWASYVLVAEHCRREMVIGDSGIFTAEELRTASVGGVGVIAGSVDRVTLEAHGVSVYPDELAPYGYMSFQPSALGPSPVMELFAAGLKVGEAMARARIDGACPREAAAKAVSRSPAMDLDGKWSWIQT